LGETKTIWTKSNFPIGYRRIFYFDKNSEFMAGWMSKFLIVFFSDIFILWLVITFIVIHHCHNAVPWPLIIIIIIIIIIRAS